MFRSYNTIQAHPINQDEPELFYGLSNITGCSAQEHPAWFASNSSYRSSFYFLIGNLYDDTTSSGITQRIRYFFFYTCHWYFVFLLLSYTWEPSSHPPFPVARRRYPEIFLSLKAGFSPSMLIIRTISRNPFFYHLLLSSLRLLVLFHQLLDGLNAESSTMAKLACFHEPQCTIWLIWYVRNVIFAWYINNKSP